VYCKLRNIEKDSDEGKEFLARKIVEQLIIIKKTREEHKAAAAATVPLVEDEDFSIMRSIFIN